MSDPYFQKLFADRIGGANYGKGTEIYKFEKIKRAKRKALAEHPERKLIDFGIGENDEMAAESVRRVMAEEINKPENRGYADNGIAAFKEAVGAVHEAASSASSSTRPPRSTTASARRPALAMLPAAFINPGDVTLMTVPGYPVAGTHTQYYGGEVYRLPLLAENDFLPDLDVDSRRHPPAGEAAGDQLSEQPDRQGGHAGVLPAGDRVRPEQRDRGRAGRRPHHAQLRGPAAELPVKCRGPGRWASRSIRSRRAGT